MALEAQAFEEEMEKFDLEEKKNSERQNKAKNKPRRDLEVSVPAKQESALSTMTESTTKAPTFFISNEELLEEYEQINKAMTYCKSHGYRDTLMYNDVMSRARQLHLQLQRIGWNEHNGYSIRTKTAVKAIYHWHGQDQARIDEKNQHKLQTEEKQKKDITTPRVLVQDDEKDVEPDRRELLQHYLSAGQLCYKSTVF